MVYHSLEMRRIEVAKPDHPDAVVLGQKTQGIEILWVLVLNYR